MLHYRVKKHKNGKGELFYMVQKRIFFVFWSSLVNRFGEYNESRVLGVAKEEAARLECQILKAKRTPIN